MKSQILAAIGETELQPAASLTAALAANDRLKYAFSLLQSCVAHAAQPGQPAASMRRERIDCGVDDPDLDQSIETARMIGAACHVEGAGRIVRRIVDDMRVMIAPVLATDGFPARLDLLLGALPTIADDLIDPAAVSEMTEAGHDKADSLHRLVMDAHKRLNVLQASMAEENLDGAAASNLADADRPLVAAFMAGVNRTAKLKFSHPGLATNATRVDDRLVIQNDIGTTDAHVIVIHVQRLSVSVTYTDVHPERLSFFQEMLKPRAVTWDSGRTAVLAAATPFYLATGRFDAPDAEACRAYLEFLGSRLVFLIDWNRARKQLKSFLRRPARDALLSWAAASEIGHRGFLELGGAGLVNRAIEATAGSAMHFGDRLFDVLRDADALDFMRFVFETTTNGLLSGQSRALIHDRVRVALAAHFSNEERQLLRLAGDHAGLIFEIASIVSDGLKAGHDGAARRSKRAARFEHQADLVVAETRRIVRRRPDYAIFATLLEAADDAADALEDSAFLIDLDALDGRPVKELQTLADLLVEAAREWIKALGHAGQIGLASDEGETEDFIGAIDRIAALEHEADEAERALTVAAMKHADDFRQLHRFSAIGAALEAAADALKSASLILHDHVLEGVIHG